jgi:hypothetical protein
MPPFSNTPTSDPAESDSRRLLRFNREVLAQALSLVAAHDGPGRPALAGPVGAHLRHIVEHYEALLGTVAGTAPIDYDRRARDRELERCPALARQRLTALQQRLAGDLLLDTPLQVRGRGGLAGEFEFAVGSTLGRELVFVASHAVHHYALLQTHCAANGVELPADFGKAPATVAHERALAASSAAAAAAATETPKPRPTKESSCPALLLPA